MAFQNRDFEQIEQLHRLVPCERSNSHSKRTAPQWQLPVCFFFTREHLSLWPTEQLLIVSPDDAESIGLAGPIRRVEHGPHAGLDLLDRIGRMREPMDDDRR